MKLEHIGIAVKSIEDGVKIWENIIGQGKSYSHKEVKPQVEEVESQKVRVAELDVGEVEPTQGVKIELIEPTSADSPVAKFLEKRGEGLHHICFEVKDIERVLSELKERGVRLIDESPRPGAFDRKIAFLHPSSTCGVLVELIEKRVDIL